MSLTHADVDNGQDEYLQLVRLHPLKAIHSPSELDTAVAMLDSLLDRCTLSVGARDYLQALTQLVEVYEARQIPVGDASDAEVLQHLIEARGVKNIDVASATGIVASTISDVLRGKRQLTRDHIARLATYFSVPVTVFGFKP